MLSEEQIDEIWNIQECASLPFSVRFARAIEAIAKLDAVLSNAELNGAAQQRPL